MVEWRAEDVERASPLGPALALTGVGGWIGVVGLSLGLPQRNLPFMSGNTSAVGRYLAGADWHEASMVLAIVLAYMLGAIGGEIAGPSLGRWRPAILISIEAALLAAAAGLRAASAGGTVSLMLALAMGVQTTTMREAGGVRVGLTYVTGTLVAACRAIAASLRGAPEGREAALYLALWLCFLVGAAAGGTAMRLSVSASVALAAAVCVLVALAEARRAQVRPSRPARIPVRPASSDRRWTR